MRQGDKKLYRRQIKLSDRCTSINKLKANASGQNEMRLKKFRCLMMGRVSPDIFNAADKKTLLH